MAEDPPQALEECFTAEGAPSRLRKAGKLVRDGAAAAEKGLVSGPLMGGQGPKAQGPPPLEKLLSEDPRALVRAFPPQSRRADLTGSLLQSKAAFPH